MPAFQELGIRDGDAKRCAQAFEKSGIVDLARLMMPKGVVDDKAPGESHVVVLSHGYWLRRFGLDPTILDQPIVVNGQTMTVVGVAERGFTGTTLPGSPGLV